MEELTLLAILCGIPAGIGVAIDKLLLTRTKSTIHMWLLEKWNQLDKLQIKNEGRVVARKIIQRAHTYGSSKTYIKTVLVAIIISLSITFLMLQLAQKFGGHDVLGYADLFGNAVLFLINLFFDGATLFVTFWIVRAFSDLSTLKALPFLALDLIFAFMLALSCIAITLIILDGESFISSYQYAYVMWVELITEGKINYLSAVLYSATTLIPTSILLLVLYTLSVSKVILAISKSWTMYFIEKATEIENDKELAVFTLTGAVFSVLATTIAGVSKSIALL